MNENTSLSIVFGLLIVTIGGCFYGTRHEEELSEREREKTKQMQIQSKIDSLKIVTQHDEKEKD